MQQQNDQFNISGRPVYSNESFLRQFDTEWDVNSLDYNISGYIDLSLDDPQTNSLCDGLHQIPDAFEPNLTDDIAENSKQITSTINKPQRLMILEMQEQLHNLTVIHQENLKKLLKEQAMQRMQQKIPEELSVEVEEAERMPMQSKTAETEIGSIDDSLQLPYLSNDVNFLERPETSQEHTQQRTQKYNRKRIIKRSSDKEAVNAEENRQLRKKPRLSSQTYRVDKSEGSLRQKKKERVPSNVRLKMTNVNGEKNGVVREESTPYFFCAECGKRFNYKCNLITHFRIHTGERPFKCGECNAAYSDKSNLIKHQLVHSRVRPFQCMICSVAFSSKGNLAQHLLIHTNDKPFKCDICKAQFRQKINLSKHMNTHATGSFFNTRKGRTNAPYIETSAPRKSIAKRSPNLRERGNNETRSRTK